ncbi:unnamed protein product [Caenorhabditis sp. 36 PRJEB53466]|nr:unnamed protein product [Caenorhabditis sp. 36 PRJEB53466]
MGLKTERDANLDRPQNLAHDVYRPVPRPPIFSESFNTLLVNTSSFEPTCFRKILSQTLDPSLQSAHHLQATTPKFRPFP